MKPENRYNWMAWAIIILAAMNIATIGTVIFQKYRSVSPEVVTEENPSQSEMASVRYSGRWFRDELGFSREQMDKFVAFNPAFRNKVRNINAGLNFLRQRMLTEMALDNFDIKRLDNLSDSIGLLHADLKKVTYKYYLDLKNICNKNQQEKLGQLFGDMFANDGHMGQYGKGVPRGKHRGRQFNN